MPHIKVIDKPNADGTPFTTLLKTHPVDSKLAVLPEGFAAYKTGPLAPPLAAVKVIRDIGNHARIEFAPHLTIGGRKHQHLYIFAPHWEGVTAMINLQVTQASPLSPFGSSLVQRQNIHFAQVNNKDWADDGTASNLRYGGVQCGLTSLAIVMSETGFLTAAQYAEVMRLSPTGKFDDGVAAVFKKIGAQSISMEGHSAVLAYFGIELVCTRSATVAELKAHIEQYGSVVMGTLYKASGHFVGATGFDIKKNLVKILDPYGIRDKQSTNQWEVQFATEADVKPDWWGPDVMADLWASTNDGWCVMPKPKGKAIVLPSAPIVAAPTAGPMPDLSQLRKAVQAMAHPELLVAETEALTAACAAEFGKFDVTTPSRIIHFLAQCAHESGGFYYLEELGDVGYFTENYEGRSDLGNTQPGDGPRFKGRGLIQTTGRNNYQLLSKETGVDYVTQPELVATYPHALTSAIAWWKRNGMNELCDGGLDDDDVKAVTKRINGGTNGLNDRLNRTDRLKLLVR
jgi:putative chitinase